MGKVEMFESKVEQMDALAERINGGVLDRVQFELMTTESGEQIGFGFGFADLRDRDCNARRFGTSIKLDLWFRAEYNIGDKIIDGRAIETPNGWVRLNKTTVILWDAFVRGEE